MVTRRPTQQGEPASSGELIQELRLHREAIERAAREEDRRHAREQAMDGMRRIVAATRTRDAPPTLPQRREKATTLHDNNIIKALIARGIDPLKMPAAPLGKKPWPLRVEVANELGISSNTAKKAFTRLRKHERMKDA